MALVHDNQVEEITRILRHGFSPVTGFASASIKRKIHTIAAFDRLAGNLVQCHRPIGAKVRSLATSPPAALPVGQVENALLRFDFHNRQTI